ncbi:bestrophin family protein [Ekhidna sp.]
MFIYKNFTLKNVWQFTGRHIIWLSIWVISVALLYKYADLQWLTIPWLPISLIGTAVAFYVGFKNNSAYDRMWEARKIWGAIVNSSRSWGIYVRAFVTDQFVEQPVSEEELTETKKKLIYRHIGWLYALRSQLLITTTWEHANQSGKTGKRAEMYQNKFGIGLIDDDVTKNELKQFLPEEEYERLINYKNTATQIIDQQSEELKKLRKKDLIEDFRHMELQALLKDFYEHQGKAERIKKFPLPRQYASVSNIFIKIFIFLLPFGMASEFIKMGDWGLGLSIPFTILVCWVFMMMELVGDYTENPFQGMGNDIPMLSLCRTIEIDLREMLGETDLPLAIEEKNGILM